MKDDVTSYYSDDYPYASYKGKGMLAGIRTQTGMELQVYN